MDAERARNFLLTLPHVVESEQWGGLVFWVGDKAIGGKMFVMLHLDGVGHPVFFPVGAERYPAMLEIDGLVPAPYMARIFWVAAEHWKMFRTSEWQQQFVAAHTITFEKLSPKTKRLLELPSGELINVVAERRKVEAAKKLVAKKKASK